jgi:hypothetical protein
VVIWLCALICGSYRANVEERTQMNLVQTRPPVWFYIRAMP